MTYNKLFVPIFISIYMIIWFFYRDSYITLCIWIISLFFLGNFLYISNPQNYNIVNRPLILSDPKFQNYILYSNILLIVEMIYLVSLLTYLLFFSI